MQFQAGSVVGFYQYSFRKFKIIRVPGTLLGALLF